jgi:hypothetical protein
VLAYLQIRRDNGTYQRHGAKHEHYIEDLDEHKVFRISKTLFMAALIAIAEPGHSH